MKRVVRPSKEIATKSHKIRVSKKEKTDRNNKLLCFLFFFISFGFSHKTVKKISFFLYKTHFLYKLNMATF